MKNDVHYLGSVRFYKHLILSITASLILLPIVGLFFLLINFFELKQDFDVLINEQQLNMGRLEEKLTSYEEQLKEINTSIHPETEESEQVQETLNASGTAAEGILLIPFDVDPEDVKYLLVNDRQPLPESYEPDLVATRNGQLVHKEIKAPLEEMIRDAKKEGFELIICSAYRDYEKQAKLVEESLNRYMSEGCDFEEAYWKVKHYLAMVGNTEHHTGLAVDLVGITYQTLDEGQANTPESKWLNEHAHEYGFILRYPKDKEAITGLMYESWHFRYVGEPAAAFIKEHQLCLEEFLDLVSRQEEEGTVNFELLSEDWID